MPELDAAVIAQARGGDSEAFRMLVERHSRAVYQLAYRVTGNAQDAEDVVQGNISQGVSTAGPLRGPVELRHVAASDRDELLGGPSALPAAPRTGRRVRNA